MLGIIGKIGAIIAVVAIIGFLFKAYTSEVETRVKYQVSAKTEALAREFQNSTAKISQKHYDEMNYKNQIINKTKQDKEREIDAIRSTYEKYIKEAPVGAGDDFERDLAHVMCLIQSGGDYEKRSTCDLQASQPYAPSKSIIISVTAETSERWRELCEEGRKDFCEYAIIGFTKDGALDFLKWLNRVDQYQYQLNTYKEQLDKTLDVIIETNK